MPKTDFSYCAEPVESFHQKYGSQIKIRKLCDIYRKNHSLSAKN